MNARMLLQSGLSCGNLSTLMGSPFVRFDTSFVFILQKQSLDQDNYLQASDALIQCALTLFCLTKLVRYSQCADTLR